MFTEWIGFLIIIGVMIVVIIRRQFFNKQLEKDDFGTAATQMQQQFEETADQIIERIGSQIDRLEFLIQAADDKIIQLDQKLKASDAQQNMTVTQPIENQTKSFEEVLQESTRDGEMIAEDSVQEVFPKQVKLKVSKTNKMVFEMLEQGESIELIAKKTGIGKGAINLIREMYKLQKKV